MSSSPQSLDKQTFFDDPASWSQASRGLERLATAIVGDPSTAQDIVQGAWLEAWKRPQGIPGLGWMRALVRNRSLDVLRRRARDPLTGVLDEDPPDREALGLKLEAQQAVLRAVNDLREPYRSTICFRYFEQLGPKAIAVHLDTSESTIKSRLNRAHQLLRETLSPQLQDEQGRWSPALIAFAGTKPVPFASALTPLLALMVMKKVLALILIIALTGGAFLTWSDGRETEAVSTQDANPAIALDASIRALEEDSPDERALVLPANETRRAPLEGIEAASPVLEERRFRGHLILVDALGEEQGNLHGHAQLTLWSGKSGASGGDTRVEIESGRFSLPVTPSVTSLDFSPLQLGGQHAMRETHFPIAGLDLEVEHEIRVIPTPWIDLAVLDASTGGDLGRVSVTRSGSPYTQHPSQARPEFRLVAGLQSPLRLQLPASMVKWSPRSVWIGSPGYAWSRVELHLETVGTREVHLVAGGDLEVIIEGEVPKDASLMVVPRTPDSAHPGPWFLGWGLESRSSDILLDGLWPNEYLVQVVRGRPRQVLAEGAVSVEAGKRSVVHITIPFQSALSMVPLKGTMVLPTAWGLSKPVININALDPSPDGSSPGGIYTPQATEDPTLWTFESEAVPPGRYTLSLQRARMDFSSLHAETFTISELGNTRIEFAVPTPITVQVSVIEEGSGQPVPGAHVSWLSDSASASTLTLRVYQSTEQNKETGLFELMAPKGSIQLSVGAAGFTSASTKLEVRPGSNRATVALRRACFLELGFKEAGVLVPKPQGGRRIQFLGESGQEGNPSERSGIPAQFSFREPGNYRVTIPDLPGYAPIPPFDVWVKAGETGEHTVILERL